MSQAFDTGKYATARKRPDKALRDASQFSGNLVVFTGAAARKSGSVNIAALETANHSTPFTPAESGQDWHTALAANSDQRHPVAIFRTVKTAWRTHAFLPSGIALSAVVMAVFWIRLAGNSPVIVERVATTTSDTSPTVTTQSGDTAKPSSTALALSDAASQEQLKSSGTPGVALPAGSVPMEQYDGEIDWLQSQNETLRSKVESLTHETLDLNRELLDLELQLATAQAQRTRTPVMQQRFVYNFVNVPLGSSIDSMPVTTAIKQGDSSTDHQHKAQQTRDDSRAAEHESALSAMDEALGFDPETGFYLNPQYADHASTANAPRKFSFPPVAPTPEYQIR